MVRWIYIIAYYSHPISKHREIIQLTITYHGII